MLKNLEQAKISKRFYKKLEVEGLAKKTTLERTRITINKILPYLEKSNKILDLACGYGRITIPLHKKGFDIKGIDISPNLIKEARKRNKKIDFKVGDMKNLPYPDESFDKIICIWSAFNELIKKSDQLKCLNEIYRVLKPGGLCLMDMPNNKQGWCRKELKIGGKGPDKRILDYIIPKLNLKIKHYIHNKKTLNKLCKLSKFKKYRIENKNIGRRRVFFFLIK